MRICSTQYPEVTGIGHRHGYLSSHPKGLDDGARAAPAQFPLDSIARSRKQKPRGVVWWAERQEAISVG
eukprot:74805-Amorphochlora_amoeboformis.AAC.1